MKKFLMILFTALLMAAVLPASASSDDRPIDLAELPAKSQQFLRDHFSGVEISYVTVDDEFFDVEYKVLFVSGVKVKFSKNGEWAEIDCKPAEVPVTILPAAIHKEAQNRFPKAHIVQISKERRGYEVELSNGLELTFDRNFRLMGIDD